MNNARSAGYALITSLILTAITAAFVVGFVSTVNTEQKVARNDTEYSSAFYAAEAGLEKLNSDLSKLFQRSVFPTQAQINDLMSSQARPVLDGISYSTYQVTGGQSTTLTAALNATATTVAVSSTAGWPSSGYFMIDAEEFSYSGITSTAFTGVVRGASGSTAAAHANGAKVTRAKVITIAEGANAGLTAQVIPFTIEVVASTTAGTETKLRREVQVALIPVFQFGVFSDSDLSFFAGPQFNFGGRVHTNGNLFLAAGSGGTTLSQKVTSAAQIIRAQLANGVATSVNHTGTVYVMQTPGTNRALAVSEASVIDGPTSAKNANWPTISLSTYNGNIRNIDTGAKQLVLPFAGGDASPIEIIRRPPPGEDAGGILGQSRLYNQASLRILLSDSVANLPGSTGVPLNGSITGAPYNYVVAKTPTFRPPFAKADPNDPDFVTAANADETSASELINGFIQIQRQNTDGSWTDVTMEILNLGISTNQPNAILRFQKPRWDRKDVTNSITATDYQPINMYDARETHFRVDSSPSTIRKIGIMNIVELDVANLARWFAGTIAGTGTQALNNSGYIVYFSDRRGNRDDSGNETGEFGFEDVVNPVSAPGTPDGVLQAGEDLNGNGVLDRYGANLPYSPYSFSTDIYTTSIPPQPALAAIDVVEPLDSSETSFSVSSSAGLSTGYYWVDNEMVNCTSISGNTLTCTRGVMGTTATAHNMIYGDLTSNITSTTTSITIGSSGGIVTPAFYRIENEYLYCTAYAAPTLTCTRGVLGSTAVAHNQIKNWLTASLTNSATSVSIYDASSFTTPAYYRIENEIVLCTSKSGNTLTCTRGAGETSAVTHTLVSSTINQSGGINATATTVTLNNASSFSVGGYYRIDSEVVLCTAKAGNVLTISRAQMGTTAATHMNGATVRTNIDIEAVNVWGVNLLPVQRAAKNRQHYFRRALRLVNGGNSSTTNVLPAPGFTVASENPVYLLGNYNAYTGSSGFSGPHSFTSVIADAVTFLSNAWSDDTAFRYPNDAASRVRSETNYRVAIAAGKGINFTKPADVSASSYADFGTDGGTHNFLRYLESGSGVNTWYRGSLVSLFYYRQATGTFKCCDAVYGPPTRQYAFDTDFLVPSQLPPGTPRFRDINNLSFRQTVRADSN
jgi:Tfp pilus assembly protein PilX